MKYATPYKTSLQSDKLEYAWTAGDRQLTMSLSWPVVEQEQWDILQKRITDMRDSDPLVQKQGVGIDRTYDYLDYYLNQIPLDITQMEQWLEQADYIPSTLKNLGTVTAINIIQQRQELCMGIQIYMEELQEALHYRGNITDDMGNIVAVDVIPGAFFNSQDNYWALRFSSLLDSIDQDQLSLCTAEIEVYSIE